VRVISIIIILSLKYSYYCLASHITLKTAIKDEEKKQDVYLNYNGIAGKDY
jgi:alkylhydroperoxidase family enzyme